MVSPTNTYVGLTRAGPGTAADEPERYRPTGDAQLCPPVRPGQRPSCRDRRICSGRRAGVSMCSTTAARPASPVYRGLAQRIKAARADAVVLSGCVCANGPQLLTDLRAVDPVAAYAGAATSVLLDAIARSDGARTSVDRALFAPSLRSSPVGPIGFTADGDAVAAPITILSGRRHGSVSKPPRRRCAPLQPYASVDGISVSRRARRAVPIQPRRPRRRPAPDRARRAWTRRC